MRRSPAREYIYTVVIIIICYLIISIFVPEMPGSVQCTERRVQRSVQCGVQALVSIDQQSEVGVHDGLICYQASQDTNNQDGPSPPGCLITSWSWWLVSSSEVNLKFLSRISELFSVFFVASQTNHNPLEQISEWMILIYSRNNRDIDSELGTFITGKSSKQSWPSDRHSSSHPVMELYICIVYLDSAFWGADTHNQWFDQHG